MTKQEYRCMLFEYIALLNELSRQELIDNPPPPPRVYEHDFGGMRRDGFIDTPVGRMTVTVAMMNFENGFYMAVIVEGPERLKTMKSRLLSYETVAAAYERGQLYERF